MKYPNIVEFEVSGDYALFSDPVFRVGGEKCSYQVPTYEALKGIANSIYWKPTFTWVIDEVRVLSLIRFESKGVRPLKYTGGNELAYYTYLKDCRYQVRAHFEWNMNRPELEDDRDEHKHFLMSKKYIEKGGRRDVFLGCRECQGYVEPCAFGSGSGYYDMVPRIEFGTMYHGLTYPDEGYSEETRTHLTKNLWSPVMEKGIIRFPRPDECPMHETLHSMGRKVFSAEKGNFSGIMEFEGKEDSV